MNESEKSEKTQKMSVSFLPNSRSVLQQKLAHVVGPASNWNNWLCVGLSSNPYANCEGCLFLGICLQADETCKGLHVVLEWTSTMHFAQECDIEFFAYENNALGFEPGQRLALKIKKIQDGENNVQSLGCAFDQQDLPFTVDILPVAPKTTKRTSLKPVQLMGGQTLNREGSTRALIAWLDKHNSDLAANFGVEKLVWCEESSGRADRNQVRVFYRVDFADNKKKRVCANATSAIEYMQMFTQSDFYDDMLYRTRDYALT